MCVGPLKPPKASIPPPPPPPPAPIAAPEAPSGVQAGDREAARRRSSLATGAGGNRTILAGALSPAQTTGSTFLGR